MRKQLRLLAVGVGIGVFGGWIILPLACARGNGNEPIIIVNGMRAIADLMTSEYHATNFVKWDTTDWAGAKRQILYFASGNVTAGIHMDSVGATFDSVNRHVVLELPPVFVRNPEVDTVKALIECGDLTAPGIPENTRNQKINEAIAGLRTAAQAAQIEAKARQNAEKFLAAFIEGFDYTAEFKPDGG